MSKAKDQNKDKGGKVTPPTHHFVFDKRNYQLMILGIIVIIIGFVLMYGTENIYDARKIKIAPVVVITGFVIEVFAILRKP